MRDCSLSPLIFSDFMYLGPQEVKLKVKGKGRGWAGLGGVTEQKFRGLKEFVKSNKYGSVVFSCNRQVEWQKLRSSKSRKGSADFILNKVKNEFKVSKLERHVLSRFQRHHTGYSKKLHWKEQTQNKKKMTSEAAKRV